MKAVQGSQVPLSPGWPSESLSQGLTSIRPVGAPVLEMWRGSCGGTKQPWSDKEPTFDIEAACLAFGKPAQLRQDRQQRAFHGDGVLARAQARELFIAGGHLTLAGFPRFLKAREPRGAVLGKILA